MRWKYLSRTIAKQRNSKNSDRGHMLDIGSCLAAFARLSSEELRPSTELAISGGQMGRRHS